MKAFLSVGIFLAASSPAWGQDAFGDAFWQFRASGGFDYSSGSYGAATKTTVTYSSATLRATKGPWTLKAVVPWMTLSGPAVLLDGTSSGSVATGQSRDVSGVGDLIFSGGYSVQKWYSRGLFVDFSLRVKAPTASVSKGLGTGKADVAGQLDVAQAFGKFMPFATIGYRVTGNPAGYSLRNVVYGTGGMQYTINERITAGASVVPERPDVRAPEMGGARFRGARGQHVPDARCRGALRPVACCRVPS